jgi:hypothetical protein
MRQRKAGIFREINIKNYCRKTSFNVFGTKTISKMSKLYEAN